MWPDQLETDPTAQLMVLVAPYRRKKRGEGADEPARVWKMSGIKQDDSRAFSARISTHRVWAGRQSPFS